MYAKWTILPFVVAAIIALMVGCGGGGSDNSSDGGAADGSSLASSSLSKDEFVQQAAEACAQAAEDAPNLAAHYLERARAKERRGADTSNSYTGLIKTVALPAIERQMAAVRKLGAPEGEEEDVEAILNAEQKGVAEVARLKHIVSRFQYERYLLKSGNMFRKYGLEACANG